MIRAVIKAVATTQVRLDENHHHPPGDADFDRLAFVIPGALIVPVYSSRIELLCHPLSTSPDDHGTDTGEENVEERGRSRGPRLSPMRREV